MSGAWQILQTSLYADRVVYVASDAARPGRKAAKEILQLQHAGISTAAAELLLARMPAEIEGLLTSGTGSRKSSAVLPKAACSAAGVGGIAHMV
jgi:hypothetical protein